MIDAEQYRNIPTELRDSPLWVPYDSVPDLKHPEKKPRKRPILKWRTPEDRKAFRALDYWLDKAQSRPDFAGMQRWVDKAEGFTYVDIDRVRNTETGEVEPWAEKLISELNTYTEISPSGKGFRIVARATLERDYHKDPDQVEIYSGNINKLMAMTGNVYGFYAAIQDRQSEVSALLARCENRQYNKEAPLATDMPLPLEEPPDPTHWREVFHMGSELSPRDTVVFIDKILSEGVTGIGSHSGVGKTWVGLSIAHALLSGQPLFGKFAVRKKANVLYLVPEMGGNAFRRRMAKMHISMDGGFFCQTVKDGAIDLQDPFLLEAVGDMRPVLILDTAIRFLKGDEQSSSEISQGFGARMFNLINHGAQAIIFMQHRSKGSKKEALSLENALRGTTDFGAMADCVWAIEHAKAPESYKGNKDSYAKESENLTRLYLECVKPRDMDPADPFVIQGRPYIDEKGDFVVLTDKEEPANLSSDDKAAMVAKMIDKDPTIGILKIGRALGIGTDRVGVLMGELGYKKTDGEWTNEGIPGLPIPATGPLR